MKKLNLTLTLVLILSATALAQKEGLRSIQQNDLRAYMTFFASDELQGRETGTLSNDVAALFIKSNIMRLGLKSLPVNSDFFQNIPFHSIKLIPKESYLKINNINGETVFSTDSVLSFLIPEKTLELSGKVVFAGYGYEDSISRYSDLKDVDLKDKIVLVMTRNIEKSQGGAGNMVFDIETDNPKAGTILEKGAKAILYVYDPKNKFSDPYLSGLTHMVSTNSVTIKDDPETTPPLIIGFIRQNAADALLKSTGYDLKQIQEKINSSGKPASFEIQDITASLKTSVENKDFTGRNVIGFIEGSDPVLKNEYIIYSAHFDHTGINENGEIMNGADDDASGSMALLEVANAFMNLKKKPLRSVLFVWVNGEEKGLLGSKYYTNNPVMPTENALVDINLDMIGRSKMPSDTGTFMGFDLTITNKGEILVYTAHESAELTRMLANSTSQAGIKVIDKGKDLEFGTSDHASFMAKGVPALLFISGIHSDLHSSRDDVEKIDFDKMEQVSKLIFLFGYQVANQRERIKLDQKPGVN